MVAQNRILSDRTAAPYLCVYSGREWPAIRKKRETHKSNGQVLVNAETGQMESAKALI